MSNLQLRVVSAVVMAVIVLGLTWLGGLPFRIFCALVSAAVFYEWSRMARHAPATGLDFFPEALLAVFILMMVAGLSPSTLLPFLLAMVIAAGIVAAARNSSQWDATGLAYAGLSGFTLALLRGDDHAGLIAILFLFAVVWATDILAYFVGRAVGGPKLAPSISPGKTQSGALGGTIGGVVAGLLVGFVAGSANLALLGLVALVLSVVSQIGDLFESWVKRRHGAKDSGTLIPGHGGVMDRVDGLVAAALALYVIGAIFASLDHPAQGLFPV